MPPLKRDPEQRQRAGVARPGGPQLQQEEDVGRFVVELGHRVHELAICIRRFVQKLSYVRISSSLPPSTR